MSGSTWESSPTFAPSSSNELVDDRPQVELGFDGAEDLLRAWRDGLTPDPDLTVSAWADRHRVLSSRGASEAGLWRTSRTPYLREIMDTLSPSHPCQRVAFMKGSQVGATESGGNWIGYVIHHAPGPMLAVQPSVELAKRFSQQRIDPLIEESPVLRENVAPARSRDSGNTVLSKEFPGGILVMTGANSAVGLRSMPVRYLFLDARHPPRPPSAGRPGTGACLSLHARLLCGLAHAPEAGAAAVRGSRPKGGGRGTALAGRRRRSLACRPRQGAHPQDRRRHASAQLPHAAGRPRHAHPQHRALR